MTEKKSRRRRKKTAAAPETAPAPAPREEERPEEPYVPRTAPRRGVRAGSLMDTGDAMPRTEFDRPDPLAGDRIMDATARLLAPRRVSLTPAASHQSRQREQKREQARAEARQEGRRSGQAQQGRAAKPAQGKEGRKKKETAPAPKEQRQKESGRRSRRRDRPRGLPPEPKRQTKDSTEQPSLMKPYYLDIGR